MVEFITFDGELHGLVIRAVVGKLEHGVAGTKFFTPPEAQLQVGVILRRAGDSIAPHEHRPQGRAVYETAEVLLVVRGTARVMFRSGDDLSIRSVRTGDVLVILKGGHGIEFLEDTELLEIKQGPFQDDKVLLGGTHENQGTV